MQTYILWTEPSLANMTSSTCAPTAMLHNTLPTETKPSQQNWHIVIRALFILRMEEKNAADKTNVWKI